MINVPRGSGLQSWDDRYPNGLSLGTDETEFSFIVPNNARLGDQELKLTGTTIDKQGAYSPAGVDAAKTTILVGAFDLTIDPSTAVTGQVIRIEGSGFAGSACIVQLKVGDILVEGIHERKSRWQYC